MSKIMQRPLSANNKTKTPLRDHNDQHQQMISKHAESKADRKRVEEEAKILENRIKLLKLEEAKANKIIEETKKKMQEVLEAKLRHQQKALTSEQLKLQRLKENEEKLQMNKNLRETNKLRVEASKENKQIKVKAQVQDVLRDLTEKKLEAITDNTLEMKKRLDNILEVKKQEQNLNIKKVQIEQEKAMIRQSAYQNKIFNEIERKEKKLNEVLALEQQEAELIKKLQMTQQAQLSLYENYEKLKMTNGSNLAYLMNDQRRESLSANVSVKLGKTARSQSAASDCFRRQ